MTDCSRLVGPKFAASVCKLEARRDYRAAREANPIYALEVGGEGFGLGWVEIEARSVEVGQVYFSQRNSASPSVIIKRRLASVGRDRANTQGAFEIKPAQSWRRSGGKLMA